MSIGVLSKAFGLPGLRLGWIATQEARLFERVRSLKHYGTICQSAPSEVLGIIALRNRKRILERNAQIMRSNLELLTAFFERHPTRLSWVPPRGGCIAFPKLLSGESADAFTSRLVEKAGVLLLPGTAYDVPGPFFRIGFGRKSLPQALALLEDAL